MKPKATFLGNNRIDHVGRVYPSRVREKIREATELYDCVIDQPDLEAHAGQLKEVEIAFATWGIPALTAREIKTYLPKLKALFYAAGTVQGFARPFLECGVHVVSGWAANAVPVAEYTASQIILANKGFFHCAAKIRASYQEARRFCEGYPGNYGSSVGILGAGAVGRRVIEILKCCELNILVFDPFLADAEAARLGVEKTSLDDIFYRCQTISNHLANNDETVGMLNARHFARMLPNATFINTGRGAQVVEQDLIDALKAMPDRMALLDVTWPEPPDRDSELLTLNNVILTPHIAGSMSDEVERMGDYIVAELHRYLNGEELLYEVNYSMLKTMA